MDEPIQSIPRVTRILISRPKTTVVLAILFCGLLSISQEPFLFWRLHSTDPAMYWIFRYANLLILPFVFIVMYSLNRENLSRWGTDITNSWDQKIVNLLFHKHPFFAPSVLAIVVGIWAVVSDSLTVLITNSSIRLGTLVFAGIAFVFSFVTCYIWLRMLSNMRTKLVTVEPKQPDSSKV